MIRIKIVISFSPLPQHFIRPAEQALLPIRNTEDHWNNVVPKRPSTPGLAPSRVRFITSNMMEHRNGTCLKRLKSIPTLLSFKYGLCRYELSPISGLMTENVKAHLDDIQFDASSSTLPVRRFPISKSCESHSWALRSPGKGSLDPHFRRLPC
jgi:hypothetical protein